jgi:hypothetical protein
MSYVVKSGDTPGAIAVTMGGTFGDWQNMVYVMPDGTVVQGADLDPTKLPVGATVYTAEEYGDGGGEGGDDTAAEEDSTEMNILQGKNMKYYFDKSSGKWYISYVTASGRELVFEATEQDMDDIFGVDVRPESFESLSLGDLLARDKVTFGGEIGEMEGEGSFESEVDRITALALDEGMLPAWAGDGADVMDIIFIAQSEGKDADWIIEKISELPSFEERFPGIDKIQAAGNLTLSEAVTGFLEMEAGIRKAITAIGADPALVTPDMVGDLLNKGHSLETVTKTIAAWKRMEDHAPALDAFNKILEAEGFAPISTLDEAISFLSGTASAEMYDLWEASSIAEAAEKAGIGEFITAEDAIEMGLEGDFTLETATAAATQAAKLLLRLRHEVNVGEFGLTHEELIDVSYGLAPRSGRTLAEIEESINRAVLTAQGKLKQKSSPYRSFGSQGQPQDASLRGLRPTT